MKLSKRLSALRKKKKVTNKEISAAIGISYDHLSAIENNYTLPSLEALQKIANYYKVSLSALLFGVTINLDELPEMEHRKSRSRNRYTLRRIFHTDLTNENREDCF